MPTVALPGENDSSGGSKTDPATTAVGIAVALASLATTPVNVMGIVPLEGLATTANVAVSRFPLGMTLAFSPATMQRFPARLSVFDAEVPAAPRATALRLTFAP